MTLKSIDAQLSLSRAMDVGTMQNQLTHKSTEDQHAAAAQAMRQQELERMRSNQVDKSAESKIRDGASQRNQQQSKDQRKQDGTEDDQQKSEHPYKGKFIDLSL